MGMGSEIASSCKSLFNQYALLLLERCNQLSQLKQIQAFLITIGIGESHFLASKFIRFCTITLANFTYARFIFDHVRSPDIFLYTAMITAYASHTDLHLSAIILYRDMLRCGYPKPDNFIYPQILKSRPELLVPHGTKQVHSHIIRSGFAQHPVVQTSLVDSYSKFCTSGIGIARRIFDEMDVRDLSCWTAMVSGYCRVGQSDNALSLFNEMPEKDTTSWNCVISGCAQNGLFLDAIYLFKTMIEGRPFIQPNHTTIACILSTCANICMLQYGRSIHCYCYRNGFERNLFILSSLVDMYGKCGSLKNAKHVFSSASSRDVTLWNSMIHCLALHGECLSAINMFEKMSNSEEGKKPDALTFLSLLTACVHGGLVEKARHYFKMMDEMYEIQPTIVHYGCLIDVLGREGLFNEAMEVVNEMKIEPDVVVWGSLLNGCKIHGRTDLAEFAVKKLVEMDPKHGGYGTMLANVYVEMGKLDESRKVRKSLDERKTYKTIGCSWRG